MFNCLRVTPWILSAKHIRATTWLGLKAQLQWVLVLLTTNRLTWRRIDMTYPQLPDLLLHKCCLISLVHSKRVDRRLAPARKMLQMQQTRGTNQNHNQLTTLKRNRWKLKKLKPFLNFFSGGCPSSCSKTHGQSNKTRRSRNRGSPGLEWLFPGHQANTRQNAVYEEEGMKATIIQGKSQDAAHRSQFDMFSNVFRTSSVCWSRLQPCGADARAALPASERKQKKADQTSTKRVCTIRVLI